MKSMSEQCRWLHDQLEELPLFRFPFKLEQLPLNGIYFFYEGGETWGHGGNEIRQRIVRIGTHRDGNFRPRIKEHFLLNHSRMEFDKNRSKPSDRSIFRKHIGRADERKGNQGYISTDFNAVTPEMGTAGRRFGKSIK